MPARPARAYGRRSWCRRGNSRQLEGRALSRPGFCLRPRLSVALQFFRPRQRVGLQAIPGHDRAWPSRQFPATTERGPPGCASPKRIMRGHCAWRRRPRQRASTPSPPTRSQEGFQAARCAPRARPVSFRYVRSLGRYGRRGRPWSCLSLRDRREPAPRWRAGRWP